MKKYIWCEFSYFDNNNHVLLVYTGKEKNFGGQSCMRCGKDLKGKTAHTFTEEEQDNAEWIFGSECVKHVWGAGLGDKVK